jgi:predicted thioesterase
VSVVALTPDLADRARIAAALGDDVTFVHAAALLPGAAVGADVVLIDLSRPGVVEVLAQVVAVGGRVVGFGPHVDTELLALAVAAGAEAVPRSRFFRDMQPFIDPKQS